MRDDIADRAEILLTRRVDVVHRRLEDARREEDLVKAGHIAGVHGIDIHRPYGFIDRRVLHLLIVGLICL